MAFAVTLGAIVCGLLLGIIFANACVSLGRNIRRTYNHGVAANVSRTALLRELILGSLLRRELWMIGIVVVGALLLPHEPWARGLLAAGTAWLVFFIVSFLIAFAASSLYSNSASPRKPPSSHDAA